MLGFVDQFSNPEQHSRILKESWIMVNTSTKEALPNNNFLEALAHKCAILAGLDYRDGFAASFDLDKTGTELLVRHRKLGDYFQPLGMSHFKKLQDFMVDAKIPRSWRGMIPLLCSPEQILWVVGWRIDERVKVTEATKNILNIKFMRQS